MKRKLLLVAAVMTLLCSMGAWGQLLPSKAPSRHAVATWVLDTESDDDTVIVDSLAGKDVPFSIEPTSLDFGEVAVGNFRREFMVITNTTDSTIWIADVRCENPDVNFSWKNGNLKAGESVIVTVTYRPLSEDSGLDDDASLFTDEMLDLDVSLKLSLKGSSALTSTEVAEKCSRTHFVLWGKDGSKMAFTLNEKPKVVFESGIMHISTSGMVADYETANLQRMTYETDLPDNVRELNGDKEVPFSREGESLTFLPSDKNLHVRIYSVGGIVMKDFVVFKNQPVSMPVSLFGAGVYVLDVNGVTYKISLQ